MGSRSKRIQIYGVGVPWGQRPTSTPGGTVVQLPIVPSNWLGRAAANALSPGAPAATTLALTQSAWIGAVAANPLLAVSFDTLLADLTPSAWLGRAGVNALVATVPQDATVAMTPSAWNGRAVQNALVAADLACCGRMYEARRECRTYTPICCSED